MFYSPSSTNRSLLQWKVGELRSWSKSWAMGWPQSVISRAQALSPGWGYFCLTNGPAPQASFNGCSPSYHLGMHGPLSQSNCGPLIQPLATRILFFWRKKGKRQVSEGAKSFENPAYFQLTTFPPPFMVSAWEGNHWESQSPSLLNLLAYLAGVVSAPGRSWHEI